MLPGLPFQSLQGDIELQIDVQGGSGSAAARRLSSGGSGGPPARLRRLRRRFAVRWRFVCGCSRTSQLPEKNVRTGALFLSIPACLIACKHASRTPEARATCRYAARAPGPRSQNTIIPSTIKAIYRVRPLKLRIRETDEGSHWAKMAKNGHGNP